MCRNKWEETLLSSTILFSFLLSAFSFFVCVCSSTCVCIAECLFTCVSAIIMFLFNLLSHWAMWRQGLPVKSIKSDLKRQGWCWGTVEQLQTSQKAVITFPFSLSPTPSLITYLGENLIETANWQTHYEKFSTKSVDPVLIIGRNIATHLPWSLWESLKGDVVSAFSDQWLESNSQ